MEPYYLNHHRIDGNAPNLFKLYLATLNEELKYYYPAVHFNVDSHLQKAMDELILNYSVQGLKKADSLNFNRIELRCAYMYLYSTSHSHMVMDLLSRYYHQQGCPELWVLIASAVGKQNVFNITSLGGGPGSDPLGILFFLKQFGLLDYCPPVCVAVVDEYQEWERPFRSLMKSFSSYLLTEEFFKEDLLQPMRQEVEIALQETHFLSLVKFISAISGDPDRTVITLSRVFALLSVGSLALIIDNAGGNDFQRALQVAYDCGMVTIFREDHVKFKINKTLEPGMNKVARYGKKAQTGATVSMAILRKDYQSFVGNLRRRHIFRSVPAFIGSSSASIQSPLALVQSPISPISSPLALVQSLAISPIPSPLALAQAPLSPIQSPPLVVPHPTQVKNKPAAKQKLRLQIQSPLVPSPALPGVESQPIKAERPAKQKLGLLERILAINAKGRSMGKDDLRRSTSSIPFSDQTTTLD